MEWQIRPDRWPEANPWASIRQRVEGGVPRNPQDRFYIQFVQKNRDDLTLVQSILDELGIMIGRLHNPSAMVVAEYWRFYVSSSSWNRFIDRVGSWHPRKRRILNERASLLGEHRIAPRPQEPGSKITMRRNGWATGGTLEH